MINGQAQVVGACESTSITCDFLVFHLDEREFAIELDKVRELRRGSEIARHDRLHEENIGTLATQVRRIPVFDAHRILGLPSICRPAALDVIVVESAAGPFALAVDDATDVVTLPVDEFMLVTTPAANRNPIWAITMHDERVLRLLDAESLMFVTAASQPERLAA